MPPLEYFEGHFPGHPVLPAIAQLRIVSQILADSENDSLRICSIPILRLAKTIQPGASITIDLKVTGLQVDCEIRQHGSSATRGRLLVRKTSS